MSQPHPVIKLITVMSILEDSELVIILNICEYCTSMMAG